MHKITPHLWFDKEARQAAEFYVSLFERSRVTNVTMLHGTPSGSVDVVSFELAGQPFMAISAGPLFTFNPSVSFLVSCGTKEEVDALWKKLSERGTALMELGSYPFSERYGWLQDRYGLSWQLMFAGGHEIRQKIRPMLMFVGKVCGKAEEAIRFYVSLFQDAKVGNILRYGPNEAPDKAGTLKYASFALQGQDFAAIDSARGHEFAFNEAISFIVSCDTQEDIDYYWEKLSAVPAAEQCGWLKDKYGLSWQVAPAAMHKMLQTADAEQMARVTKAFLPMKKFDLAELQRAYEGRETRQPVSRG
jgi:predicted 3-demethylubiquinone-9 3-methyltransferase (glyoxalase superfamily)